MLPHAKIAGIIKRNECFLRQDALIVFVCGRAMDAKSSRRKIFLEYAYKHIQGFHFLLAEDLFSLSDKRDQDLLTIEKELTKYSDCIVIILESPSAFTELGAFAVHDELCSIILPINDRAFSKYSSFINHGPLEKIDSLKRGLGPTIQADMDSFAHCFSEVQGRLERIKKKRRERLGVEFFSDFVDRHKERLLLVFELINLFAPLSRKELIGLFKKVYGDKRFTDVHFDIQLLTALKFVADFDGYLYSKAPSLRFVDFGKSYIKLKSDVILYYKKNSPERLKLLKKVAEHGS
jgi:hypothetical protein